MKRLQSLLALSVAAIAAVLMWAGQAEAADWQQVDQLGRVPVTQVVVDPANRLEVAALAGDLWLSHDGGLTWRNQAFPAGLPAYVAYDPVHPGVLAVAAYNTCLMVSRDGGLTWTQHRIPFNYYCNGQQVIGTKDGFVFSVQQVIGYTAHLFRLSDDGTLTDMSSFPDIRPGSLAYDQEDNRLCVGTTTELYCSSDGGSVWIRLAAANQIGNSPHNILIHVGEPWLVSDKGVMVYRQNGWLAPVYNDSSQGSPLSGLVINGDDIIYGLNSGSLGDVVTFTSNGPEPTGLHQHVYGLDRSGEAVFAATGSGLFVTRDIAHSEAKIRRPVIVIPGITASLPGPKNFGALELDPYTHTYDPLLARLRAVGYVDDKTLFAFPYDWRVPNEDTAELLKETIAQAKAVCGCPKVDIVGHSMGGLVARSYIEGSDYADDVNKLIEVGTPNAGSLSSYYTWEAGELYNDGANYDRVKTDLLSGLFHLEAYSRGYASFKQYVHERVTTVQELLPVFNYIQDRTYPEGYPRNSFLDQLDAPASVQLLEQRVRLRIIGGDTLDTLKRLVVGDPGPGNNWPDGQVESVVFGPGDGTVLTSSLAALAPVDDYENADHGHLTTVAQNTIVRYLLEDDADQTYLNGIPDEMAKQAAVTVAEAAASATHYQVLYVLGAGKASVTTHEGTLGAGGNTITNAYYSGDQDVEHLFTIPDPATSNFTIRFEAGGGGQQQVQFGGVYIDNTANDPEASQDTAAMAPGDVVEVAYNAANQTLKIGSIERPAASGQGSLTQSAGETSVGGQAEQSDSPPALQNAAVLSNTNNALNNQKTVAVLERGINMVAQAPALAVRAQWLPATHVTGAIIAPKIMGLHFYGLDFWLAIAVIITLMLALGIWLVLRHI